MGNYLDWNKILSYNAPMNLINTIRGRGKTYGIRKQCVKDFTKSKSKFCEIVRCKEHIKLVSRGYFDKLVVNNEFPEYMFKTEGAYGYIAKKPVPYWYENGKGETVEKTDKPEWEECCYFLDLNTQDLTKKRTFTNVKRFIFDEAILPPDKRGNYLADEYGQLMNLVDTVTRETEDNPVDFHIYLLGNACDIVNPYYIEFGITSTPKHGFRWIDKGLILLYFEQEEAVSDAKKNTLVGRLSRGHNQAMFDNEFENASDEFLGKKPATAEFNYGIKFQGNTFGIWADWDEGLFYVNSKVPNGGDVYALTLADNAPNMTMVKRASPRLNVLGEMVYNNAVRYDRPVTRERFAEMLKLLGVR